MYYINGQKMANWVFMDSAEISEREFYGLMKAFQNVGGEVGHLPRIFLSHVVVIVYSRRFIAIFLRCICMYMYLYICLNYIPCIKKNQLGKCYFEG